MVEAKSDSIHKYKSQIDNLVVMFGAHNCKFCTDFIKYEMDKLESVNPRVVFMFMDGNKFEKSADACKVRYFPTFVRFTNGEITGSVQSTDPLEIIKELGLKK